MTEDKKGKFKRKLTGDPVDWREYSFRLLLIVAKAELRELEFSPQSKYFYDAIADMEDTLKLTEEEKAQVLVMWVDWMRENDLIDSI